MAAPAGGAGALRLLASEGGWGASWRGVAPRRRATCRSTRPAAANSQPDGKRTLCSCRPMMELEAASFARWKTDECRRRLRTATWSVSGVRCVGRGYGGDMRVPSRFSGDSARGAEDTENPEAKTTTHTPLATSAAISDQACPRGVIERPTSGWGLNLLRAVRASSLEIRRRPNSLRRSSRPVVRPSLVSLETV